VVTFLPIARLTVASKHPAPPIRLFPLVDIAMETCSSELERAYVECVLIFAKELPLLVCFLGEAVIVGSIVGKVRTFIDIYGGCSSTTCRIYRSACCRRAPQFKDLEREAYIASEKARLSAENASIKAAVDAEKARRLSAESAREEAGLTAESLSAEIASIKAAADANRRILDFITSSDYKRLPYGLDKGNERLHG